MHFRFMSALIDWISRPNTEGETLLVAMPGVGDIGKLAIDAINLELDAEPIARIMHPAFPPLAKLDNDGLLQPPHVLLSKLEIDNHIIFTLTGDAQPMTPEGQHELAKSIIEIFTGGEIIVFAGMVTNPERKEVFAVTGSSKYRIKLEKQGVDVRRSEPKAGIIGMAALITALSPVHGVNSSCVIATTVGKSLDPLGAQLLLETVRKWWSLPLPIPIDATNRLANKLKEMHPEKADDLISEMSDSANSIYM